MKEPSHRIMLTLAIPTFNRLDCLRLLIESVMHQIPPEGFLGEKLEILICNNASGDGTTEYLDGLSDVKGVRIVHHATNCGGAANVVFCCEAAAGKYVWIMGDDDIPLVGAILAIMECLERDEPDLLYLPARWISGDLSRYARNGIKTKSLSSFDCMGVAVHASAHVTFISSWVVNMDTYKRHVDQPRLDRFNDTSFPHLEWILTVLERGNTLLCADDDWVIARGGCSGGYAVFDAFSHQYNQIVDEKLSGNIRLHDFLKRCMYWRFIPGLVWGVRRNSTGSFGEFDKYQVANILKAAYGNDIFFRLLVAPITNFYTPVAWLFRVAAGVLGKSWLFMCRSRVALVNRCNAPSIR